MHHRLSREYLLARTPFHKLVPFASLSRPPVAANCTRPGDVDMAARVVALEYRIPSREGPIRLDEALVQLLPAEFPTLTRSKRSIRRGELLVQGATAKTTTEVRGGELVQWLQRSQAAVPDWRGDHLSPDLPPVQVVFEDDHMACVVKPQNMPVDVGSGGVRVTLQHCLPRVLQPSTAVGALRQPHYAHRLDEATGGLLLVGKSRAALRALGDAFADRRIAKRYRALAWGRVEGRGLVKYSLDGKPSETEYLAVSHSRVRLRGSSDGSDSNAAAGEGEEAAGPAPPAAAPAVLGPSSCSGGGATAADGAGAPGVVQWVTTLDLWPRTGRTHQLRRHMALIGHPLVGDRKYTHGYAKQRVANGDGLPQGGTVVLEAESGSRGPAARGQAGAGPARQVQQPGGAPKEAAVRQQEQPAVQSQQGHRLQQLAVQAQPPPQQQPTVQSQQQQQQQPAVQPQQPQPRHSGHQPGEARRAAEPWELPAADCGGCGQGLPRAPPAAAPGAARAWGRSVGARYSAPVLCLWAVQLDLAHPVTGEQFHFELDEPQVYEVVRDELGTAGAC